MLDLGSQNAARAGARNVRFLKGEIEAIPLPEASVDVVISNCVINLSGDKPSVLREAARVLRPGGRLAFTDVVADPEMDEATRQDNAGLQEIEITETHRVHEYAGSAIIRARKPGAEACCSAGEQASCCEPAAKADCCGSTTCGCR